ncbi:L,D-transpeptidase [Actinokineospora terrae]|uniref:Uncharacterized protein n=1 Tax=Actinokineospora terrae TaxID=155974 RepID=A0A1H9M8J1_9PSEU|nr:L,D-transpeptidase [Actinokineospora terrae]SER20100.1 hypothetical protein SAMN04487818_10229 [Actinokineospora terrae]
MSTGRDGDLVLVDTPLPAASWAAALPGAPRDPEPHALPHPARLTPLVPVPVHRVPEGDPFAELPVEVLAGLPTWLPVVGACPGWARVLLPTHPDGAVGWVALDERVVVVPHHNHLVVDTRARAVTLHCGPNRVTWPAGVGTPAHPTPRGRTVVLGAIEIPRGLVNLALVLAAHHPTHLAHGAGIAAVGVHTWPTTGFGLAGSDGSVLVPPEAMPVLIECAPAGTAVLVR